LIDHESFLLVALHREREMQAGSSRRRSRRRRRWWWVFLVS
jgi:hypothetical protein